MDTALLYRLLADIVLISHAGFVLFVIAGFGLILAGGLRGWNWIRNRRFRIAHLAAIGIVVLQVWLGMMCPLTVFENWLRIRAGQAAYAGDFISHWLGAVLYWDLPAWAFGFIYTGFGALVLVCWFAVPPRRRSR